MAILEGTSLEELNLEYFKPGQKLELLIGLPKEVSDKQMSDFEARLIEKGIELTSPVQFGSGPWENTLRLEFRNPALEGVGFAWLLAVVVIGGLAAVGIASYFGYKLTAAVTSPTFLITMGLLIGVIYLAATYIGKKA